MMAWALVSTLTCLVKDYHGMLAARLLLGVTEAPVGSEKLELYKSSLTSLAVLPRCFIYDQPILHSERSCHKNVNLLHRKYVS
jgi:hypothetical protein